MLAGAQLFRTLEPTDVEPVLAHFTIRDLPSGTRIFEQGDTDVDEMYVVLSGRIAITRHVDDIRRRSQIIGPGETFGELSVLDPGPRERTAWALTPVRLATISRDDYIAWALARPHVAERLLRILARRLRRTDDEALDLLFVDVGARLARTLVDLASRFGQSTNAGISVEHGFSQSQLAEIVGTSRETLNKQLSGFIERGWITAGRGRFLLKDPERLETRARVGGTAVPPNRVTIDQRP
jgi:CRP/FNR family cyclic AMP-dependent transcriptional regulator